MNKADYRKIAHFVVKALNGAIFPQISTGSVIWITDSDRTLG